MTLWFGEFFHSLNLVSQPQSHLLKVIPAQVPGTMSLLTWAAPGVSQFSAGTGREPQEGMPSPTFVDNWVRVLKRCLWTVFLSKQQTA